MSIPLQRISAYGIARREDSVLMVQIGQSEHGDAGKWMLPGGGVEHGEHPADAVVREFDEETGYRIQVDHLVEVGSDHRLLSGRIDFHGVFIVYAVTVVGGEPRGEIAGPMRTPTWHPLSTLDSLPTLEAFRPVIAGSTTAAADSNVDKISRGRHSTAGIAE